MPRLQEDLLQLLLAISEGRGEEAAQTAIKIGEPRDGFDQAEFTRRISSIVAQQKTATVEKMQVGRLVLEVAQTAADCQIRVPAKLTILGKTLDALVNNELKVSGLWRGRGNPRCEMWSLPGAGIVLLCNILFHDRWEPG